MDLAERLRRLGYGSAASAPAPPAPPRAGLPLESALSGEWRETVHGRCFVGRAVYPFEHEYGGVRLGEVFALEGRALALAGRDSALARTDFARVAFLDTETTGLAGGTGTYVFLVGLGYFEGESFVVEQYFMADYSQERAMLAALTQTLVRFDTLATFNGKVFDWPLLQTRYAMARQRPPLSDPAHLDLLFPARRLWRERVGSCALSSLEENVLGVRRLVDVPGWLIPSIYFQYVRDNDASPLRSVFAHNEQDILSLLALTVRLGRHLAQPTSEGAHPIDLYATGRIFEGVEDWERAVLCYEQALSQALPAATRAQASCRLGFVYKRLRQSENALALWRELVDSSDGVGLTAYVELAKHLEHAERNYPAAAQTVERALSMLSARPRNPWGGDGSGRQRQELQRRLGRLQSKMARAPVAGRLPRIVRVATAGPATDGSSGG